MAKQNGQDGKPQRPKTQDSARYPPGWNELGDFIVSFGFVERGGKRHLQTRAYYSQGDQFTVWDGVAKEEMCRWIFDQASAFLPSKTPPKKPAPQDEPLNAPEFEALDMEVVDLHLAEVQMEGGGSQLRAAGRLRLYHPRHQEGRNTGAFRIELFLVDQDTGVQSRVAEQHDRFESRELARDILMYFPKPGVGRYRLEATVTSVESGVILTEALGPILRVE